MGLTTHANLPDIRGAASGTFRFEGREGQTALAGEAVTGQDDITIKDGNKMAKTCFLFAVFFTFILAQVCLADMYQYVDKQGVVHFTDDPQKIPARLRGQSRKNAESSLSTKESNMAEHLMQLDKTTDFPVGNMTEFKKNVDDFADGYKDKYDDPDQAKDARLSTPDGALNLFRSALRTGNVRDFKASVSTHYWQTFKSMDDPSLKKLLHEMDKHITGRIISKGEHDEHFARYEFIEKGDGAIGGTIELINLFGNWKVHSL